MPEKINTSEPETWKLLPKLNLPAGASHKGQNGRLLIIGGSAMFHSASRWSFEVASRVVDMVFYASTPENNELLMAAKKDLRDGLVTPREQVLAYAAEADCILIGPGMTRGAFPEKSVDFSGVADLDVATWNGDTYHIVNFLLTKFPEKKMVIDAGALQMVEPSLLNKHHLITPHHKEYEALRARLTPDTLDNLQAVTILEKGARDVVSVGSVAQAEIVGGNAGMTKGGTGDALAGLVAALYSTNDALTSAMWGSVVCKSAGDKLYEKVGTFFNASDLAAQIPVTFWEMVKKWREV